MSAKESKPKKKSDERELVSMDAWISQKLAQDQKLRKIQRRELEVFLQKQGLGKSEDSEKYEEAYAKF